MLPYLGLSGRSSVYPRYRDFQGTFKRTRPEISPFEVLKCSWNWKLDPDLFPWGDVKEVDLLILSRLF